MLRRRQWMTMTAAGWMAWPRVLRAERDAGEPQVDAGSGSRVLVMGDSMIAGALGLYLERALNAAGHRALRRGKSSSGLARPDFFDWQSEAKRLVETFEPEATLVMFGGNDVQGLWMGKDEWVRWPEPGWEAEYARRVVTLLETLAPSNQKVFWLGMPVMRPEKFHLRVQRINRVVRAEMAIRSNTRFVDTWNVLAVDGKYADHVRVPDPKRGDERTRKVLVRAGDGIHLTRAGAEIMCNAVLESVLAELPRT